MEEESSAAVSSSAPPSATGAGGGRRDGQPRRRISEWGDAAFDEDEYEDDGYNSDVSREDDNCDMDMIELDDMAPSGSGGGAGIKRGEGVEDLNTNSREKAILPLTSQNVSIMGHEKGVRWGSFDVDHDVEAAQGGVNGRQGPKAFPQRRFADDAHTNSSAGYAGSSGSALLSRPKTTRNFFTLEVLSVKESKVIFWGVIFIYIGLLIGAAIVPYYTVEQDIKPVGSCLGLDPSLYPMGCLFNGTDASGAVTLNYNRTFSWSIYQGIWTLETAFINLVKQDLNADIEASFTIFDAADTFGERKVYLKKEFIYKLVCSKSETLCDDVQIVNTYDMLCSQDNCDRMCSAVELFSVQLVLKYDFSTQPMPLGVGYEFYNPTTYKVMGSICVVFMAFLLVCVGLMFYKSFAVLPMSEWCVQHRLGLAFAVSGLLQFNIFQLVAIFNPSSRFAYMIKAIMANFGFVFSFVILVSMMHSLQYRTALKSMPFRFYVWKIVHSFFLIALLCSFYIYGTLKSKKFVYYNSLLGLEAPESSSDSANDSDQPNVLAVIVVFGVMLLYVLGFFIWTVVLARRIVKVLKKLPYVTSRFRHLAVKTILYIYIMMLLINIWNLIFQAAGVPNHDLATTYGKLFSFTQLYGVFAAVILGYVFLPAQASGHSIDAFFLNSNGFSIIEARFMIMFASEAYRIGNEQKGLKPEVFGYKLLHVMQDEVIDANGIVCLKDQKLVVAYRGTKSKKNWKTDLKYEKVKLKEEWAAYDKLDHGLMDRLRERIIRLKKRFGAHIKVHAGFWESHVCVRDEIIEVVKRHWKPELGPVNLTGHSLGGAMATLLAFELTLKHEIPCVLYTFGCPRVGNKLFALRFDHAVPRAYRICADGDVICGLPKFQYKHIGNHIIVDKMGNLIVNPSGYERLIKVKSRRRFGCHKMARYRNSINAAVKIDRRLGMYLDAEENIQLKDDEYMFRTDRLCISYGIASVLPIAALTGAVLVGDEVPKPLTDIPSVMFQIDDLTEQGGLLEASDSEHEVDKKPIRSKKDGSGKREEYSAAEEEYLSGEPTYQSPPKLT
eukprot:Nk52_evm26s228 gene=Nk52_evmTU26s228